MPPARWLLLIHQLPPKPLYLRAKIRNRLARVGAFALKNSVYVLPERDDCLEDLQWIAQEAVAGGGEAFVCRAELVAGVSTEALVAHFRRAADAAYAELKREISRALERGAAARGSSAAEAQAPAEAGRFRKRFQEIAAIDFYPAASGREVEAMLRKLEARIARAGEAEGPRGRHRTGLKGRTWVTRRDPHVDRLASAWLVRRFVDPRARFRFIDAQREQPKPREIGFDMVGGEFTHEGDRCTFETLRTRLGIVDPALQPIAEIVHDIDLKDSRYGRPDTVGFHQVVQGLIRAHPDDEGRLARALALFDDLYASFRGPAAKRAAPGGRKARGASRRKPA